MSRPPKSTMERFWAKVNKTDTCWLWTGSYGNHGYGNFRYKNTIRTAHRVAYMELVGEIPEGMCVCHTCDNTLCVRPDHLWLGTKSDNSLDRDRKKRGYQSRKTHCPQGHPYAEKLDSRGHRRCYICMGEATKRFKAKKVNKIREQRKKTDE
jgi:hypothetical protein